MRTVPEVTSFRFHLVLEVTRKVQALRMEEGAGRDPTSDSTLASRWHLCDPGQDSSTLSLGFYTCEV